MTMAVDSSSFQKEHQIQEFQEGNGNVPVCLKLNKQPNVDDLNAKLPLDIPPILVEETSLPRGLHGSQAQDVYSISMVPKEGENARSASPLAFLSVVEVPNQAKSGVCLDTHINCQNSIDFQMNRKDIYAQCIVDIPNVNGNSVSPESYDDGVESFKTGNSPKSVLWRESSLKAGAKLMQSLVNLGSPRDKPVTEKLHDLPSNKWRRYKRSTSFDSRKVALLFSILSSLGTLVLIYLTLRVRQKADVFVLS
ncbi:hypothetical protein MtrunA17_Chr3g0123961 [Medicago truncatula]|uniref:Plant/T5J17-70 protein, putative n=1 Tax=Medicago truncatula TaxID=3880 RepID=G7J3R2_MEDTR|nr:uncharacterized protein LOC11427792 [Medicago truncatula]AES72197.1 plant/T5J17-70 protein, putative [Medicago truncatula]RHN69371.1 hypothetical protein MtrunA17_Chr3g0123961 [Medicago truncatula]